MIIDEKYCKKQLKRLGQKVKTKRTILEDGKERKYTLEEALEYANNSKNIITLNISKDDYLDIINLLIQYKADVPTANKKLVDKYFKTRWQLREFVSRLADRGFYYMSTKRMLSYFNIISDESEEE